MPFVLVRLLLAGLEHKVVGIGLGLGVPDQSDVVVSSWVFLGVGIVDWMNMQTGCFGFS